MSIDAYVCTRDMNIQDNFIVIAATVTAAVVLVSAIFISTVDVCHQQSLPELFNAEEDILDSDVSCDPCPNNSTFYHIGVLRGNQSSSRSYMFVDLVDFPSNSCCNVIAKPKSEIDLTDIRVNYCRNITTHGQIEFISFAHINSLVGVEEILEGYNLSLRVRNTADRSTYQMLLESQPASGNFALAFKSPNTTDKYYVIPQWMDDDMALLTIHKNPYHVDKFVFKFVPSISSEGAQSVAT